MDDYDVTLAAMTSHAAARPACAPIQGKIVNTVPESDPRYNPKFDSIYNHDYGKASGTQGANCHHELYPYLEGIISTNPFEHPDTKKAIANGEIQQHQRALERKVRHDKKMIHYSAKMKDVVGQSHYKDMLSRHRSQLRDVVKNHDFLYRDYSREKIAISKRKPIKGNVRISGALNNKNDPGEKKRLKFADNYYRELKKVDNRILYDTISKNSGIKMSTVSTAMNHVLYSKYELFDSKTYGTIKRNFDTSYDMAQSMQRLRVGKPLKHDIIMLKHEAYEAKLMDEQGLNYKEAHRLTNRVYNYEILVKKFNSSKE